MRQVSGFGRVLLKNAAIGLVGAGVVLGVSLPLFHALSVREQTENTAAFYAALTAVCTVSEWVRARKSAERSPAEPKSAQPKSAGPKSVRPNTR